LERGVAERVEILFDVEAGHLLAPSGDEGVFSTTGCVFLAIALVLITVPAFLFGRPKRGGSEAERWADAMFTPQGELNE
jgi:hypothetical protein